jgi:hypothetical protein
MTTENITVYENQDFNFSVSFPNKWDYKISPMMEPTEHFEGTPDSGVTIFLNDKHEDYIYVFGQLGHINIGLNWSEEKNFITNSGKTGKMVLDNYNDRQEIWVIKDDPSVKGFIGMSVQVSNELYKKNEEEILAVLKSLEIQSI